MLYKIRKNGVNKYIKIMAYRLHELLITFWLTRIPWFLRFRFYYNLARLILVRSSGKKRILGIWDYKALPWSVGDPLAFIETLSVLKLKYDAEVIDICIVYDQDNPAGNRSGPSSNLTSENVQDYMLDFLPLFSTCPYLGSVYQFNSREEFYRFFKSTCHRYEIFPTLARHLSETYNFFSGTFNFNEIQEFYNDKGYIPYLRIGRREQAWSSWFYKNYLSKGTVPIALSLKQTSHDLFRNADPAVWLPFIDKCRMSYPEVIFIVVGLREEVFPGLRDRPNVVIAKDHGTSVGEDLALIQESLMYMGTNSGINIIAIFSDLPYLVFKVTDSLWKRAGMRTEEKFSFQTENQKMFSFLTPITPDLIFNEFKEIYHRIDCKEWENRTFNRASIKHSLPSAKIIRGKN